MAFWFPDLSSKEVIELSFDYSTILDSGATISSATVTKISADGSTSSLTPTISGLTVAFTVSTFSAGVYDIECLATSSSKIYEQTGHIRIFS